MYQVVDVDGGLLQMSMTILMKLKKMKKIQLQPLPDQVVVDLQGYKIKGNKIFKYWLVLKVTLFCFTE